MGKKPLPFVRLGVISRKSAWPLICLLRQQIGGGSSSTKVEVATCHGNVIILSSITFNLGNFNLVVKFHHQGPENKMCRVPCASAINWGSRTRPKQLISDTRVV